MGGKKFEVGDKIIVIGRHEADNYWIGIINEIGGDNVYIDVGNHGISVNIKNIEHYDPTINWVDFYRQKFPESRFWSED